MADHFFLTGERRCPQELYVGNLPYQQRHEKLRAAFEVPRGAGLSQRGDRSRHRTPPKASVSSSSSRKPKLRLPRKRDRKRPNSMAADTCGLRPRNALRRPAGGGYGGGGGGGYGGGGYGGGGGGYGRRLIFDIVPHGVPGSGRTTAGPGNLSRASKETSFGRPGHFWSLTRGGGSLGSIVPGEGASV